MGDEDVMASPGTLLSVPARVEHRFHSIEQDLLLLVFLAPAEGSGEKEQSD
jgi:mannose-6-phosphate isomerase-like protein (cupin superfamily)